MLALRKIVQDTDLGQISYESSQRAQRVNVTVKSPRFVRVAVPHGVSWRTAERFVATHRLWIKKQQLKLRSGSTKILLAPPENSVAAKAEISQRLTELAEAFGFQYGQVSFRNQKTRWGSCSRKNNISLNLKLVRLPQHLQDYILLHELVHTRVKNHGPRFWQHLDTVTNAKAKVLARELRQYRLI
jgi:hypothetical protein